MLARQENGGILDAIVQPQVVGSWTIAYYVHVLYPLFKLRDAVMKDLSSGC